MNDLKRFLDEHAARINSVEFIAHDPVQFPRRFEHKQDIEIAGLLSGTIAWGNRKMICNNCAKMLAIMDNAPYDYVMDGAYECLDDNMNIHRTFFARNFKHYLRGLRHIYSHYPTLDDFAAHHHVGDSETPSWTLVEHMQRAFVEANGGQTDSRCLPMDLRTTALKRINMVLRWFVRNDGIVDIGIWESIKPSQLFIPLDVHVGDTARALGMTMRKQNDRKTVLELTALLRKFRPDDPVLYDYALFGIGVSSHN